MGFIRFIRPTFLCSTPIGESASGAFIRVYPRKVLLFLNWFPSVCLLIKSNSML